MDAIHTTLPTPTPVGVIHILTVAKLRDMLKDVDGEVQVVIAGKSYSDLEPDDWYNVAEVAVPGWDVDSNQHAAVTLYPSDDYDYRQH